jgi:hypothetical protein
LFFIFFELILENYKNKNLKLEYNMNDQVKKPYSIDEILEKKGVVGTEEGIFMKNVLKKSASNINSITYDYFRDKYFLKKDIDYNSFLKEHVKNYNPFQKSKRKNRIGQKRRTNKQVKEKLNPSINMINNKISYIKKLNGDDKIYPNKIYEYEVLMELIPIKYNHVEADVVLVNAKIHKEIDDLIFYEGKEILCQLKSFQK